MAGPGGTTGPAVFAGAEGAATVPGATEVRDADGVEEEQ
jgi:hypothetical protein